MDFTLVVVQPFGRHGSGDAITDPERIAAVLGGEHADKVVRVHADEVVRVHADEVVRVARPAEEPAAPPAEEEEH